MYDLLCIRDSRSQVVYRISEKIYNIYRKTSMMKFLLWKNVGSTIFAAQKMKLSITNFFIYWRSS